ncbi:hypothetical protein GC163_17175 [bacterium]|nr:hypothetical protein [bacterium]
MVYDWLANVRRGIVVRAASRRPGRRYSASHQAAQIQMLEPRILLAGTSSEADAFVDAPAVAMTNQPPVIADQAFSIIKESAVGTVVGTVQASDPDAGDMLTYSISGGNVNQAFLIDPATGVISVNSSQAINYLSTPTFTLRIAATDTSLVTRKANVTVNVLDVNSPPVVTDQTFSVPENSSVGTFVGAVAATDVNRADTLVYSFSGGNVNQAFRIDAATGVISVNNTAALDRETLPTFTLRVAVTDTGNPALTRKANITVNLSNVNEPPTISPATFTIVKNLPAGRVVGSITASDPDLSAGDQLTYSFSGGNVSNTFAIHPTTGVITVNNPALLDYVSQPVFHLRVAVTDTGNITRKADVTVNVLDVNSPPEIADQSFSIAENLAVSTFVGQVIARDINPTDTLTYGLSGGNVNNAFAIDTVTGVITVRTPSALNFEALPVFTLRVAVTDTASPAQTRKANITVNLTNVNEPPLIVDQMFSINENLSSGIVVGTATATDPDAGDAVRYSISGGNVSQAFRINPETGAIAINNPAAINFELNPVFTLRVAATDSGSLTRKSNVTVRLNDLNEAPEVVDRTFTIPENRVAGTVIGTVTAVDPDAGNTVTYAFSGGNVGNAFAIDPTTGVITVRTPAAINFEANPVFALRVQATDDATMPLSKKANITVNLTNLNEEPVIADQTLSIAENSALGAIVGNVIATDPDAGDQLTYAFSGGNIEQAFAIDPSTGVIRVNNPAKFNFEALANFALRVQVTDSAGLTRKANVAVNVLNVNEPPVVQAVTPFRTGPGSEVRFEVFATDPDGPNQPLTLSLTGAPNGAVVDSMTHTFRWTPTTAQIGEFNFQLSVSDGEFTASTPVNIVVKRFGISHVTPANGTTNVSLTRETVVTFNAPVDPSTITANSLYAIANGERIPASIRVSANERTATLFYDDPLPSSTEVRVVIDGSIITGRSGELLDADGNGVAGGVRNVDFRTLSLTNIPNTTVWGYVYDSYNRNPDGGDRPIVGAKIFLDADPNVFSVTDQNGRFELGLQDANNDGVPDGLPAPDFFVHIDGSQASNAPAGAVYATLGKAFHSVPGERTQLNMAGTPFNVYLPPMFGDDIVTLNGSDDATVGFGADAQAAIRNNLFPNDPAKAEMAIDATRVIYPAGSAQDESGNPATRASIIPVDPSRLPAPLPPNVDPSLVISIQAGTDAGFNLAGGSMNFDTPAPVSFPNLDGLAPGAKSLIWSFDHDAGHWEVVGTGTVSADGTAIVSDPGVGILAPGWHFTDPGATVNGRGATIFSPDFYDDCTTQETIKAWAHVATDVAVVAAEFLPITKFAKGVIKSIDSLNDYFAKINDINTNPTIDSPGWEAIKATLNLGASLVFNFVPGSSLLKRFGKSGELADKILTNVSNASEAAQSISSGCALDWPEINTYATRAYNIASTAKSINRALSPTATFIDRVPITLSAIDFVLGFNFNPNEALPQDVVNALNSTMVELEELVDQYSPFSASGLDDFSSGLSDLNTENSSNLLSLDNYLQSKHSASEIRGNGTVNYVISDLDLGDSQRGSFDSDAGLPPLVLRPDGSYRIDFYGPDGSIGSIGVNTPGNGENVTLPPVIFQTPDVFGEDADSDFDGLPDFGEWVFGTSTSNSDTDDDGISDGAEIQQGTNPLDGRGFPTGVIASLPLRGEANEVVLEGSTLQGDRQTAYVATGSYGLAIVDASRFDNPIILGQLDLKGTATDVAVDGVRQLAAVAAGTGGIHIVDVSDPMLPRLVRTLDVQTNQLEVYDGVIYAAVGADLQSYDLLTGEPLQTLDLGTETITGLAREGGFLYTMDNARNLEVVDITGFVMARRGGVQLTHGGGKITVGGGIVYASPANYSRGGYATANVSNPAVPVQISASDVVAPNIAPGTLAIPNGSGRGLVIGQPGSSGQVYVVDMTNPANTDVAGAQFITRFDLPGTPQSAAIGAGIGFIATGSRGLQVVNYLPFDTQRTAPMLTANFASLDVDAGTAGIQVVEGSTISLPVQLSDDVQVRNVELLLNGQVVENDVSFPFDLAGSMPNLAAGSTTATLQVRATDTGGNVTLSPLTTVNLVADTTPPTIVSIMPADGALRFQGLNTVRLQFSEPVDPTTINGSTIRLTPTSGGSSLVPVDIQFRARGTEAVVTFDLQSLGMYNLNINRDGIKDRAGNAVGGGSQSRTLSIVADPDPGDFLGGALNVGELSSTPFTFSDRIGKDAIDQPDPVDVFRFTLATDKNVTYSLSGLTKQMRAEVYVDGNQDGQFNSNELIETRFISSSGTVTEPLSAGEYFLRLTPSNSNDDTYYTLNLSAAALPADDGQNDPGATIATARNLGTLSSTPVTVVDAVRTYDDDVYKFTVTNDSIVTAAFTGIDEYVDMLLYFDGDNDGLFDSNELIESRFTSSNLTFMEPLSAGTYYLLVRPDSSSSNVYYSLSLSAAAIPSDDGQNDPGDTIATARNLGTLSSTPITLVDAVRTYDNDVYKFTITNDSNVTAAFSGIDEYVDMLLYFDGDNDGEFDSNENIEYRFTSGNLTIVEPLSAGTYYLLVRPDSSSSNAYYTLSLSAAALPGDDGQNDPGDTIATARNLGTLSSTPVTVVDAVRTYDDDVYKFTITTDSNVTAAFTGIDEYVDMLIYFDGDNDGQFDSNENIEYRYSNGNLTIVEPLSAGTYYLLVRPDGSSYNAYYSLSLSAAALPGDDGQNDPGDTIATARNLGTLSSTPITVVDTVRTFDSDVYKFTITNDSNVTAAFTGIDEYVDMLIYFDGDNDGQFDSNENIEYRYSNGNLTIVEPLSAGTYYLLVRPDGNSYNAYYSLSLSAAALPGDDGQNDPGDTIATARNLGTLSSTPIIVVDTVRTYDDDVYKFTISNDALITGAFSGVTESLSVGLYLDANSNGTLESSELLQSQTVTSTFSLLKPLVAGTYYLRVAPSSSSENSSFSLSLSQQPVQMTPPPGFFGTEFTKITFDDLPSGTALSSQYQNYGVNFSIAETGEVKAGGLGGNTDATSGLNSLFWRKTTNSSDPGAWLVVDFVDSMFSSLPTAVGFMATDTPNSPMTAVAYNAAGVEVSRFTTPNTFDSSASPVATQKEDQFVGLTSSQGISRIEIRAERHSNGSIVGAEIDDLQFNRRLVIPETPVAVANYQFQNNLSSTVGASSLAAVGTGAYVSDTVLGQSRTVYSFTAGNGLQLNTNGLIPSNNYTIELVFRFDDTSGYQKVLDFANRQSDGGLYVLNGGLNFYQASGSTTGGVVPTSQYIHLVARRSSATNEFSAWIGGSPVINFPDSNSLAAVSVANLLHLFVDDTVTGGEVAPGRVALLRVYNQALSTDQIQLLANNPFTPAMVVAKSESQEIRSDSTNNLSSNSIAGSLIPFPSLHQFTTIYSLEPQQLPIAKVSDSTTSTSPSTSTSRFNRTRRRDWYATASTLEHEQ